RRAGGGGDDRGRVRNGVAGDGRGAPAGRPPRRDDGRGRLGRGPVAAGGREGRGVRPHEDGRGDRREQGRGDEDVREREARGQVCGGPAEASPEDLTLKSRA